MVCKISYLLWFPDIPNKAGRKTRRRRTHAISKCYAFHAHTIKRDINYLSYHIKKFIKWSPGSVLQKPTNFSKLFVWYCSTEIKKKGFPKLISTVDTTKRQPPGNALHWSIFLDKVTGWTFKYFPVNFVKTIENCFLHDTSEQLVCTTSKDDLGIWEVYFNII